MKGSDAIQQHTGIEVDRVIALEKKLGFKGETSTSIISSRRMQEIS